MSRASDDELAALRVRVAELEEDLRAALAANAVLTKKVSIHSFFPLLCDDCADCIVCTQTAHMEKAFEDLMGKFGNKGTTAADGTAATTGPPSARERPISPRTSDRQQRE